MCHAKQQTFVPAAPLKFSAPSIGPFRVFSSHVEFTLEMLSNAFTASQHMTGVAEDHNQAVHQADLTDTAGQVQMQPRLKLLSCRCWRSSCSGQCAVKLTGAASPQPATLELLLSELLLTSWSILRSSALVTA